MGSACFPCDYCANHPSHVRWKDDIEGTKITDFICSECIESEKKDPRIFIGFRISLLIARKHIKHLYDRAHRAESKITKLEAEIKDLKKDKE